MDFKGATTQLVLNHVVKRLPKYHPLVTSTLDYSLKSLISQVNALRMLYRLNCFTYGLDVLHSDVTTLSVRISESTHGNIQSSSYSLHFSSVLFPLALNAAVSRVRFHSEMDHWPEVAGVRHNLSSPPQRGFCTL